MTTNAAVTATISDYHLAEFYSDGTEWYLVVKDQNGSTIMQTTPVLWANTENTGEDYWFFWGDDCTTYFHGDGESDYIYANYSPK